MTQVSNVSPPVSRLGRALNPADHRRYKRVPMFQCLECGRRFYSAGAAKRAMWHGCPGCGGSDVDIYVPKGGGS